MTGKTCRRIFLLLCTVVLSFTWISLSFSEEGSWTCEKCGNTDNYGLFCGQCGAPRPAGPSDRDDEWTCTSCQWCGNTGNFCSNCGEPRPVKEKWTCRVCGKQDNLDEICGDCKNAKGSWICGNCSILYSAADICCSRCAAYANPTPEPEVSLQQQLYELGRSYEQTGDIEKAIQAYHEAGDYEDAGEKAIALQNGLDYQTAESLYQAGDLKGALALYQKVSGYQDADSKIALCSDAIAKAAARSEAYQPGKYITFGQYPQTSAGDDQTPIEWLVLANENGKALLISRYALDCRPYNTEFTKVTWKTCTLHRWLNNEFINRAFTAQQQTAILTTEVDNSKSQGNSEWSTSGGNNTQDKVFLLSYAEANQYFKNDDARKCQPTAYAVKQNAFTESNGNCWWWLRSPGSSSSSACSVQGSGGRDHLCVDYDDIAVRPAFWLDLTSGIF